MDPLLATYAGVPGHDDAWGDYSPEGYEERRELLEGALDEVRSLPGADDRWSELAVRIAIEWIEDELEPIVEGDHLRDVSHMASIFPAVRDVFDLMDMSSEDGVADVASRLETMAEVLDGYLRSLDEGVRRGLVAPRRQVESVAEQMRAAAAGEGRIARIPDDLSENGVDDARIVTRIKLAARAACDAILAAAEHLETRYLPHASDRDGWGEERYRRDARRYLGTELDLHETYDWGWRRIDEVRARIVEVAREIDPGRDLDEVAHLLRTDPERAVDSPGRFREQVQQRLDDAVDDLAGTVVDIPDEIRRCEVHVAAPGTPPGAWYQAPSEDFTRPGSAWWSFPDRTHIPMYEAVSVAYHEGFPGHHLQIGYAMTISDRLSRVHRLLHWKPGYGEGWGLYAERLMDELGYLDQPEHVFGMLTEALLRASRVVVDLGSHLDLPIAEGRGTSPGERWSFERGVEFLEREAFLGREYAESEMTRYLGWPAQAISYAVGERAILELRDEARQREGSEFDLKVFHERVLGSGSLGLDLLGEVVLAEG